MNRPTTHWCHDVSVPGPVDPDGCCAEFPPVCNCNAGRYYPKGTGPDPARCHVHGHPAPTAASIAAGIRHTADTDAADRLAKGLRGERS